MQFMLDAFAAVPISTLLKYAILGALLGAVAMPAIMFVGFKLNLKQTRTTFDAARIPRNARLYKLFSIAGAVLFAVLLASQPVLDAAGDNEVWIRGALIPVLMLVGWPFVRALKRIRDEDAKP